MRSIVVGTDGSPGAEKAVRWTIDLARGRDVSVCVVAAFPRAGVAEPLAGTARMQPVHLVDAAENVVARVARDFTDAGIKVDTDTREGDPASVIIDVAEERDADLIVVGSRGHTGLHRFLLGSVASKVAQHAPHSVTIVRD
jgi:nucleotide-binding universal stress UspA family protein